MLLYIIKWFIIYFLIIFLLHNLYNFLKENLTHNQTVDLVNYSNQQYEKIHS